VRIIKFYRYVHTRNIAGKYLTKCICTAPFGQFKWVRYKLFSWSIESENCLWRLDGRSVSRIEGIEIIENKPEEARLWTNW